MDEEYETFVLILINENASLRYNDVSAALVNHEVKRKGKESSSSSISVEVLTAKRVGSNHNKGKGDFEKSKTGDREDLKKKQYVFCGEE